MVVAGDDGTVTVTYYDFRNDVDTVDSEDVELVDHFAVHCHPEVEDCTDPASWADDGDEARLTEASFNILEAPNAGGLFLGDYVGLASDGVDFLSIFAKSDDPTGDPATIFFRRATSPAPVM